MLGYREPEANNKQKRIQKRRLYNGYDTFGVRFTLAARPVLSGRLRSDKLVKDLVKH